MSERNFNQLLAARWAQGKFVCVGLDTDAKKLLDLDVYKASEVVKFHDRAIAAIGQTRFSVAIVDTTADLVAAYKPNSAFFEAQGSKGIEALQQIIAYIHAVAPEVPVILDAKRGDIGNTNDGYVEYAFDYLGADAITVHPFLGKEALKPFLDCGDKGIIVLCRTSNPGAGEFQDLHVDEAVLRMDMPLYKRVAHNVAKSWNDNGNCALVVGATYPQELVAVREIVGDMPILIPGIGAQGGDLEAAVKGGRDANGTGFVINSSRGIIFASTSEDFAEAARAETIKLHDQITAVPTA